QPIIMGRTHDAVNPLPHALPQHKTRMSIKSKTHKGTGFNELRFEDKKGEEEIYVHAEKDYRRLIKNNEIVKIEGELKVNVIQASEKKAKSIQITANDFIEFNLGANQIKMTPTQITVAGKNVSIKGQAMTTIQGGMVKINAGGSGASQAKTNLENMAVGAKTGEFEGFGKNVTEEISFTEKTKSTASQGGGGAPPSEGGYGKDDAASLALDAMPVVGVLKGIAQVIVGKDLITGETLNRGAEALATVAGIVPGGKVAAKVGMKVAGGKNAGKIPETQFGKLRLSYEYYKNLGWSKGRIKSHLDGIDFSKPVKLTELPKGNKTSQFQVPGGKVGHYFAKPNAKATELGINPSAEVNGVIVKKTKTIFELNSNTTVLESTARSGIVDIWSAPSKPFKTTGGGTQYFTRDNTAFIPKD
ncbi:MAG: polymorphic toxin type 46 domain-containing protein, partial [Thiomicrorhabdus sp.]|nr:polymorphic toxin type 46 domain-containing protein [Thiomicrorhabdus sp.]